MKTLRKQTHWTKQVGEALVCVELGRQGFVASAFSGNVTGFDVIAVDGRFRAVPIQVKAFSHAPENHPCWPLTGKFLDIKIDKKTLKQQVKGLKLGATGGLIHVFVLLKGLTGGGSCDRFFICTGNDVRRACLRNYRAFLKRNGGKRPRNPESKEVRLCPSDLSTFEDNWDLVRAAFRASH